MLLPRSFLLKVIITALFSIIMLVNTSAWAENTYIIKAAVAKEFKHGLHSRYLNYLAEQLGMEINIVTMPLARRIIEVQKGNLDLIVGLQYSQNRAQELHYIYPAYETLSFRFFALTQHAAQVKSYDDLFGKLIGVVRGAEHYADFSQDARLKKYKLKGLESGIQMLSHQRIDLLIHYEESTLPMLHALAVEEKISKTLYQPEHSHKLYIAISKHSPLLAKKQQLQAIVEQGIKQQDFLHIRLRYYQDK